jgi:hyperosmotically inducible protein
MHRHYFAQHKLAITLLIGLGTSLATAASTLRLDTPQFDKFDSNGDARVSLEEFKAQHQDVRAFTQADLNKDGWLDQDEYLKAMAITSRLPVADLISDSWITTKIKSLLLEDNVLNGIKIEVNTQDRMVQLSGNLSSMEQISHAVKIASQVQGVKAVHNDLRLKE